LSIINQKPRSSRGPGRRPFTAVARVRIPYAVQAFAKAKEIQNPNVLIPKFLFQDGVFGFFCLSFSQFSICLFTAAAPGSPKGIPVGESRTRYRPSPRSSRGLGRRPFTAVARVRIPYAVQAFAKAKEIQNPNVLIPKCLFRDGVFGFFVCDILIFQSAFSRRQHRVPPKGSPWENPVRGTGLRQSEGNSKSECSNSEMFVSGWSIRIFLFVLLSVKQPAMPLLTAARLHCLQ
jgi:hypothetical protein